MPDNKPTHLDLFSGIPLGDFLWHSKPKDLKPSDSVRLTPTPAPCSKNIGPTSPTTEICETFQPSNAMSLQADFLASHSVLPASDEARAMTVRSGQKCLRLLNAADPLLSLAKTLLESSTWNSTVCFLTWKTKATPQGRLLFQLAPSMPDTDETGCGLWRSPGAQDGQRGAQDGQRGAQDGEERLAQGHAMSLASQVKTPKLWPTPRKEGFDAGCHRGKPDSLHAAVKFWPTVCATEARQGLQIRREGKKGTQQSLSTAVKLWPTPSAQEMRTTDRDALIARRERCKATSKNGNGFGLTLGNAMTMEGRTGQLNPDWVEWLMGYPIGHTALNASETASFRKSRKSSPAPSSRT